MRTLSILLKTSWRGWVNSIRYASEERRKKFAEIIGFLMLVAALYLTGKAVFREASSQLADAYSPVMLQAINLFMAFGVFILAKDAMEGSLKLFYEASDTSLLLSSPLLPPTVFGFKLIQLIVSNLLSMVIWLFPPWIAFGQLFGLPWHFYVALIPICFCLLVIIISEISIVMMVIIRFFSSRQMIQFLKILGTTIGVSAGFLLSMSFIAMNQSDRIAQFILARLKAPASAWYPHLWAAKLMMSWLPGANEQTLRWVFQLVGATIGVPALGVLLASRIYYRSWEYAKRVEVGSRRKRKRLTAPSLAGRWKIRSMMAKDFLVFIRNRGRVTMIVMLTLILLIVMLGIAYEMRKKGASGQEPDLRVFGMWVQVMLYSVLATLGLTWGGFKAEAKTWWLLKSGPVSPELLFNSKFFIATLCSVTYTNIWISLGLILLRVPMWHGLSLLGVTAVITATAIAFNTAMGTLPWVAEIGKTDRDSGKQPILRIATILLTIVANGVILIVPPLLLQFFILNENLNGTPQFSLSLAQQLIMTATFSLMIGIWGASYLLGKRSLRKLLA